MSWDSRVIPAIDNAVAKRDPRIWWLPGPMVANLLSFRVAVESGGKADITGAAGEVGLYQFLNNASYRPAGAGDDWRSDPTLASLAATTFLGQAASGAPGVVFGVPFAAQVAAHTAWTRGTYKATLSPSFSSSADEARVMGLVEEYGWRMVWWWIAQAAAAWLLGRYLASIRYPRLAFLAYVVAVGSVIPPLLGLLYARGMIWQRAAVSPTSTAGVSKNPTWPGTMTADASDGLPPEGETEVAEDDEFGLPPQSDTTGEPDEYGQYPESRL